jgi:hypothetical protein
MSQTSGIKLGVKASTTAEIPFIGKTGIELSAEYSSSLAWGSTNTVTETYVSTIPVVAPPHTIYQGTAYVKASKLLIPFTGTVYY